MKKYGLSCKYDMSIANNTCFWLVCTPYLVSRQPEIYFSNKTYKLILFYLAFKVLYSQLLSSPPICSWVIVESDGKYDQGIVHI